jgi:hypothetical protein
VSVLDPEVGETCGEVGNDRRVKRLQRPQCACILVANPLLEAECQTPRRVFCWYVELARVERGECVDAGPGFKSRRDI